ncbi:MAG: tRNA uracil 4-sulfurtransferase ThiI [Candidatus Rokuibacteriota bacterium]
MRAGVIVHYNEISLKRGNRPLFLRHLVRNLARATADLGGVAVRQLPGRILLEFDQAEAAEAVRDRAARVCGISSVAVAYRVPSSVEAMKPAVARIVGDRVFRTFRMSARRAFRSYPLTSVELNRELGAFVLAGREGAIRVNLRDPELEIHVEVLPAETFVYADRVPGPGGLPVGVSGTVAALLSGGIDSPVAAWRMMKRGCRVIFVHFHSVPYLPATSQAKARALVERLTPWQYRSELLLVPLGEIQREVVLSVPPPVRVVVYRRMMVRIAEALGRLMGVQALTTGESLGQVASQTLTNLARIDEVAELPLLRPLVGMDKLEITGEAQRLGTFEISIEPDADCCTLFVPRHPSTRVSVNEIRAAEERLDIARLVAMGTAGAVRETFEFPQAAVGGGRAAGLPPAMSDA